MFSKVSSFLPTRVFENIYSTVLETLDLGTALVAPKSMSQAAFKTPNEVYHSGVVEVLREIVDKFKKAVEEPQRTLT